MSTHQPGFGAPSRPGRYFAFAALSVALGIGLYFYFDVIEQQGGVASLPWLVAELYETGGKPLAVGFFGLLAAIAGGIGVASLVSKNSAAAEVGGRPPMAPGELTSVLMPALEFGPAELEANRRGGLTPAQQARLSEMSRKSSAYGIVGGLVMVLLLAGVGAYVLFWSPSGAALKDGIASDPTLRIMLPIVLGLVLLALFGSLGLSLYRASAVGRGRLSVAEGPIKLDAQSMGLEARMLVGAFGGQTRICTAKIGGMTFYVSEKALAGFKHGAAYRIYYVNNKPAHVIMSAEALTDR
ncbi:MAG TPA: hypothetical protein VD886_12600 [Herpetosiphonaceae bacterium]|nr:hypothetical protein [Herpetosiphonaceae bacterium]